MSFLRSIFMLCFCLSVGSQATAASSCKDAISSWDFLRKQELLATQDQHGGCGFSCAVNLASSLLVRSGKNPIQNPQDIYLDLISDHRAPLAYGLYPSQVMDLVSKVIEKTEPGMKLEWKGEFLKGFFSRERMRNLRIVNQFSEESLEDGDLVFSVVFGTSGTVLGIHVQGIYEAKQGELTIVEPNKPYQPISLFFDKMNVDTYGNKSPRYIYSRPFYFKAVRAYAKSIVPVAIIKGRIVDGT